MSCNEWKTVKLGEVAEILSGYAFKTKDFIEKGIPVVKIKNIIPPIIDINDTQYVSNTLYEEKIRFSLNYDDILISLTGSNVNQLSSAVGKIGRVKLRDTKLLLNQRVGKLYITNKQCCNYDYLYYYLIQPDVRYNLASSAGGSANQANISPSQIKDIYIKLPPLEEQEKIANILSSLDDKIQLNNEMNKTLEEMAQALFKRWFVDFEFTTEDDAPYKSSGGEMVESELGMIPKGWEAKTLDDIGDIISGGTPSTKNEDYYGGDISWITPKDLSGYDRKFISKGERSITQLGLQKSSAKLLPKGTVLFSSRAPIGYVAIAENEVSTNQGFKSIICNDEIMNNNYIYYFLKYNKENIENVSSGSTFKEISGTHMKNIKITVPKKIILGRFNEVIESYNELLRKNYIENDSLVEIRDNLLSKLMNGEINI